MSRRRSSHSEAALTASEPANPALAYPFSNSHQSHQTHRRGPIEGPYGQRLTRRVTWRSSTYKLVAYLYVLAVLYIVWLIRDIFFLPFSSSSSSPAQRSSQGVAPDDHLARFMGSDECGISSTSLYTPPTGDGALRNAYCQNRAALLDAMSNGGRQGTGTSYDPQGCHYRWLSTDEICDVLNRFDGIVFVGDGPLFSIYAAFNILLRENLVFGSLKQWDMDSRQLEECKCDKQFSNSQCLAFRIGSSEEVYSYDGKASSRSPYVCPAYIRHIFLPVTGSPSPRSVHDKFQEIMPATAGGNKPVPVIHSLSLSTYLSRKTAAASMDEWLGFARASGRKVPFLWIGPTSAGYQNQRDTVGSQEDLALQQYTLDTARTAHSKGMEVLSMYNATSEATSLHGSSSGEKTSLMQAMMILNWLSHL
ncbi:hypothetical protein DTO027B5_3181 [Paecilomyces variotii]|nr:hypothetical protein DTO169E5_730 [Paecilomyces variotii]KAJ9264811.1 hypothetical protein DTO212C5_6927 [Paecilomyces variotii]KAJ9290293.1 hypothetical protein DTO021C3_2292 [Paecilomyces variotii]KAJ9328685.1 hypothetical protein DTO027B3_951 [Paecilomyces variotii]KAJ9334964.1 hypothetical protein DTO027B5_3181 [Paecilomyces variotii]